MAHLPGLPPIVRAAQGQGKHNSRPNQGSLPAPTHDQTCQKGGPAVPPRQQQISTFTQTTLTPWPYHLQGSALTPTQETPKPYHPVPAPAWHLPRSPLIAPGSPTRVPQAHTHQTPASQPKLTGTHSLPTKR